MHAGERKQLQHHIHSGLLAISDNVSFILVGIKEKVGKVE